MQRRFFLLIISILVCLTTVVSILAAPESWLYTLIEEPYFPLGNLISALGLTAFPCIFFFGIKSIYKPINKRDKLFSTLFKVSIFLSSLWILVGYLLSGNLSNTFGNATGFQGSEMATNIFWQFNYGLLLLPVLTFVAFLLFKIKTRKSA